MESATAPELQENGGLVSIPPEDDVNSDTELLTDHVINSGGARDHDVATKGLNAKFESLDYDNCENELFQEEERFKSYRQVQKIQVSRWVVMFFIGVLTGLVAAVIDICITHLTSIKFQLVKEYFDKCMINDCLVIPQMIWVSINTAMVCVAAILVAFIAPVAAGSGIPQIKCFLNGVKIPYVVRIKTLICKVVGVILSVAGGLAIGKEGPMIHAGSVIAAGISQGRSSTFRLDCRLFEYFRTDTEKRDFVSAGAAAGVSAAFGAPVGGVLFSLEEGASFWNQGQTWRIFFASMMSTFTLNVVQSYVHNVPWRLSFSGLLNFGQFVNLEYSGAELPVYVLMGVLGGLFGALFNYINYKLSIFRKRYVYQPWKQVLEACVVAINSTVIAYILLFTVKDCQALGKDPTGHPLQVSCEDGQYNAMASLWLQTPEESVRSLFHDPAGSFTLLTVGLFALFYFLLACWTYGLSVPSGLFIPSLLTGAAWGRGVGIILRLIFPHGSWLDPGKFALIGAAAQLGGVVRMTISLTVILIEATGNISFGLPIMIVLMVAKWVGDIFNEGLYDIHIELQNVPILRWEPPEMSSNIFAREVMSHPVKTLNVVEKVGNIVECLQEDLHDGYPVVQDFSPEQYNINETFGTLRGLITRTQLLVILKNKAFNQPGVGSHGRPHLRIRHFRDCYPRYPKIEGLDISVDDRELEVNLKPYMNPAPYSVSDNTSLPRVFKLFRGLGLRHLVVVNLNNQVIGLVTRKDLARYKFVTHGGQIGLEELQISSH